jgi:hypothetical protein
MCFSEELKNDLSFGYKINILNGYTFNKAYIFKNWVNDLYKMRLDYPKTDPMNFIAKLLLNSFYGRFGFTSNNLVDILDTIDLGNNILVNYKDYPSLEDELGQSDFLTNVNISTTSAVTKAPTI